jgi:hypothetical protein
MIDLKNPVPGIYDNVSFEDYLRLDCISNSYLSRLAITPAHAKIKEDDTKSLSTGRMIHTFVLEGATGFAKRYKIAEKMNRNTKVWKELAKEAEKEGREAIQEHDFKLIEAVSHSILGYPDIEEMLLGEVEQTVIWETPEGILCKARPDVMQSTTGTLFDLKTTKDAGDFVRAVCNYGYDRQAVHYLRGVNAVSPFLFTKFVFLAVELKPPYRVQDYDLEPEFLASSEADLDNLIQIELGCIARDEWPNHTLDYHGGHRKTLECPTWHLNRRG